jgi:hypothetical protein
MPEAIDLTQADSAYYSASTIPELVEVGPVRVLGLEGRGAPGGAALWGALTRFRPREASCGRRVVRPVDLPGVGS